MPFLYTQVTSDQERVVDNNVAYNVEKKSSIGTLNGRNIYLAQGDTVVYNSFQRFLCYVAGLFLAIISSTARIVWWKKGELGKRVITVIDFSNNTPANPVKSAVNGPVIAPNRSSMPERWVAAQPASAAPAVHAQIAPSPAPAQPIIPSPVQNAASQAQKTAHAHIIPLPPTPSPAPAQPIIPSPAQNAATQAEKAAAALVNTPLPQAGQDRDRKGRLKQLLTVVNDGRITPELRIEAGLQAVELSPEECRNYLIGLYQELDRNIDLKDQRYFSKAVTFFEKIEKSGTSEQAWEATKMLVKLHSTFPAWIN